MFFVVSKVFFFFARPLNLLIFLLVGGLLLSATRFGRAGRRVVAVATLLFVVIGFSPLVRAGLHVLENRFPRPGVLDPAPEGIIVLGGALDVQVVGTRPGLVPYNDAAERLMEVGPLAKLYPEARIVFTGGGDRSDPAAPTEAEAARALFLSFGIAPERILVEDRSRTTSENGLYTRELVRPTPGRAWLLVTSAWHMPRAVGVFRAVGWSELVAYPTDYRTPGDGRYRFDPASENFVGAEILTREVAGLVGYRLTGRTKDLFPAP